MDSEAKVRLLRRRFVGPVLGPDGTLYVVELDEASWAPIELGFAGLGGTVNSCDSSTWTCTEAATGLSMPIAVAVDRQGTVYAAVDALVPSAARVIALQ